MLMMMMMKILILWEACRVAPVAMNVAIASIFGAIVLQATAKKKSVENPTVLPR